MTDAQTERKAIVAWAFVARWRRLFAMIATAVIGCGGAYLILSSPDMPKGLVAASGVMAAVGGFAALSLLVFIAVVIVDDVRPSFRFRRPVVPMALAHREASLVGRRSYRNHPIKFWGGLILNNSFFVGFMVFGKPEHESFQMDDAHLNPETNNAG